MTLIVNLFAGPGTGKSTTASLVFGKLKQAGVDCEFVSEYAKELIWEDRLDLLSFQPRVIAEQMWRQERLIGQVEVIITDSPILLTLIYQNNMPLSFDSFMMDMWDRYDNLNYFLLRKPDSGYTTKGRVQTEEEALEVDARIHWLLQDRRIPFQRLVARTDSTVDCIVSQVLARGRTFRPWSALTEGPEF